MQALIMQVVEWQFKFNTQIQKISTFEVRVKIRKELNLLNWDGDVQTELESKDIDLLNSDEIIFLAEETSPCSAVETFPCALQR